MELRTFIHDVLNKITIAQGMLQSGIKLLKDENADKALAIQKFEKALNSIFALSEIVQKFRSEQSYSQQNTPEEK